MRKKKKEFGLLVFWEKGGKAGPSNWNQLTSVKISEAVFHWSVWHFQEKAVIMLVGKIIGGLEAHRCTVPLKKEAFSESDRKCGDS